MEKNKTKKPQINVKTFDEHLAYKKNQMGMTVAEFHDKLDDLLTDEYIRQVEENQKILNQWLDDARPIYTTHKKNRRELDLQEGEYFEPCFDPDQPVRNELPVFWFMSNFGNLLTVRSNGKVYWLPPKLNTSGRGEQKWQNKITGKLSSLPHYAIGGLIFHPEKVFGTAKEMLELFGSYGFGQKGSPWNVQAHHEEPLHGNMDGQYNFDIIGTLTVEAHELLRSLRTSNKKALRAVTESERDALNIETMARIAATIDKEGVKEPVVIQAGLADDPTKGIYSYRLLSAEDSPFTADQLEYIKNFTKSLQILLAD